MTRIIFHLGPGKCGSSAIQRYLHRVSALPDAPLVAALMTGADVQALEDGEKEVHRRYADLMALAGAQDKPLIISHEALFKKRGALLGLAQAARGLGAETSALAYVRKQSDFLFSVYAQWIFREPDRIKETADILRGHKIDPALFTGAERHLMAIALGHLDVGRQAGGQTYFDWLKSMPETAAFLAPFDVYLDVAALPPRDAARPLVADFMARIGVPEPTTLTQTAVVNAAFDPAMIEAVSNALEAGYPMPGRHEANDFLAADDKTVQSIPMPDRAFLNYLGDFIDSGFEARNRRLSEIFGIDPAYFEPRQRPHLADLNDTIHEEAARRAQVPPSERAERITARTEAIVAAWQQYQSRRAS